MNPGFDAFAMPLAALCAVLLDRLLGEVPRFHPLVGFGHVATGIEAKLNRRSLAGGIIAWLLAVGPWVALAFWLRSLAPFAVDVVLLYFALGAQSLCEHAEAIARPLREGRLEEARQRVGYVVSRETSRWPRGRAVPPRQHAGRDVGLPYRTFQSVRPLCRAA